MSLHSVLIKNLGSEYAKEHNIKGGNSGIKIICYSYDSSTIQAAAEYSVKNPFDIFGIGYIKVVQEFTYEVWLGEKYAGDYGKDKDNTDSVFITRTGTVYHKTRNCPALYIDVKMVDFSQINNYRNKNGSYFRSQILPVCNSETTHTKLQKKCLKMLWLDLKKESEKITMSDNSSKNNGLSALFGFYFC